MYTTCEAGKRRTVNHTRARSLASPSRAGPGRGRGRDEARRGAARPAGRTGGARARALAPEGGHNSLLGRDVQVRCGAARCGAMAILPLTAINRAIKRAIKSVINGHNRIT